MFNGLASVIGSYLLLKQEQEDGRISEAKHAAALAWISRGRHVPLTKMFPSPTENYDHENSQNRRTRHK